MSKGETYLIRRTAGSEKPGELIRVPDELIVLAGNAQRQAAEDVVIQATVRDLLFVLFRHARKSLLFFAAVLAVAAAAAFLLPSSYRSEARLLVRLGPESMLPDPSVQIGKAVVAPIQNRNAEINTELQILRSREVAESVIAAVGPQRILAGAPLQPAPNLNRDDATVRAAIIAIDARLVVEVEPDSNVLAVSFEAKDPVVARDVVNAYVDQFRSTRSRIYRDPKTAQFFGDKESAIREQIAQLEQTIRSLKDQTGVADLESQRAVIIARVGRIQTEMDTLESALTATGAGPAHPGRARLKALQQQRGDAEASLQVINEVAAKLAALEREHGIKADTFKQYAAIAQQAAIDRQMSASELSNISVVQAASMPLAPSKPNRKLLLGVGLFLALTGAIGLAFVAEAVDHTVKRPADLSALGVARSVSVPLIPGLSKTNGSPRVERLPTARPTATAAAAAGVLANRGEGPGFASGPWSQEDPTDPNGTITEPAHRPVSWFHDLRQGVRRLAERVLTGTAADGGNPRVIAMISCRTGHGASTLACATAALLAERVLLDQPQGEIDAALLIDADLHSPTLHRQFGVDPSPGLTDWLADPTGINTPLDAMIRSSAVDGLHLMPAGALRGGTLTPNRLRRLLDVLAPNYRYVIIDLPSLDESPEAARLAAECDGAVLVLEADTLRKQVAIEALQTLREANVHLLGAVLNKRDFPVPQWLYERL